MTYDRVYSARFKRDLRRVKKRGKDLTLIEAVIDTLAEGETLSPERRDHPLRGQYKGFRECHIEDDWLLVYKIDRDILVLLLSRTGTHFGSWQTVYSRFRLWSKNDILKKIFDCLSADADMQDISDSTSCKVHQHASGAKKGLKMRKQIKI